MKTGRSWPRPEYVDPASNLRTISNLLMGTDFKYQADLVYLLRQNEPDIPEICRLFALSKSDLSGWDDIVRELVMSDDEILLAWDNKRNTAANSGTWMHAMFEHLLNGYKIQPGPMHGELAAVIAFLSELGNMEVFRAEWCICAPEEDLAGSIDLVLKDKDADIFHLVDWKRSEKLQDKYVSYGKKMISPLHEVDDCQGQHYRLQLNIYKWILERYYNISVATMKVVCVHPRYLPGGFVDDVPEMQSIVGALMQCCRDKKTAISIHNTQGVADMKHMNSERPRQEIKERECEEAESDGIPPRQNSQDDIPDTLPFRVELPAPVHTQDDMETALERLMMEDDDTAGPLMTKRRRLMPGAATHAADCTTMFKRSLDIIKDTLDGYGPDVCLQPNTILQNTRKMLGNLHQKYPWLSEQLKRLIMVAAHMSEGKIGDKPMLPDAAAIVWMVEGDRHMRVHKGFLYIYDDDGCFLPFGGIPPEAVLHRIHDFFCCLEGLFRRMKPETRRGADRVAEAIVADLQNFETDLEFLDACRAATCKRSDVPAYSQRLDAPGPEEEGEAPDPRHAGCDAGEVWTMDLAERSWKVSCTMKQELMQTRMVALLVEWCESEDRRSSTICYEDICFAYDRPGSLHSVEVIRKGPQNDCYVRIPHPLLDPVLDANMERLQKFYERTFWCNLDVFKCFQAAAAIAKRGLNVDRCFIGISPGGVGQSLYSLHLSEMYKHNHAFFDPNIWHLDEELRKQVESFARCFILTGQEAPETSKKLHIDLYKKTISGDGIMGRKPYGYTTRMFQTIGWTRLEVNRVMAFMGVSNNNFNSMFRRSFVWKAKARFVHGKFLKHYPDHEQDGIFEADPSLNKFLVTSQASVAGLKLQWAFEVDHSKEDCYQLIENYCNGGDNYLTEDVMRDACGLPVRLRQVHEQEGLGNLLAADQESADEQQERDTAWNNLRDFLMAHMLDSDLDVMTYYEFKKLSFKPKEHPNLAKGAMWDQLLEQGVVRTAIVRGKTSKEKPGAFIPKFTFGRKHGDICPQPPLDSVRMSFEEEHDVGLAIRYAYSCRGRSLNMETMKKLYTSLMPPSRKGRRTAEQDEIRAKYQTILRKLDDHEQALQKLVVTKQRRLREKKSVEEQGRGPTSQDASDARMGTSWKQTRAVTYGYSEKQEYSVRARRYTTNGGVQAMSRRLQYHAVDGHTVDLDIQNCCLTLLQQIMTKVKPCPPMSDDLVGLLNRLVTDRAGVLQQLGLHIVEGKEIINTVLNGGNPPASLKSHDIVRGLQRMSQYFRWMACNLLHDDYMSLAENKQKTFPSSTIMSLMWTSIEDVILRSWTEHVLQNPNKPGHLSLHFDGIRVSADHIGESQEDYIKACQDAIYKHTGFQVKIVAKKHSSFIELVKSKGTHANALTNVPAILLQAGNCIPCALWHVVPLSRPTVTTAISDEALPRNVEATKLRYRDYRSLASLCSVDLACCVGLPASHIKSFLLHYEGDGIPHCVAVRVDGPGVSATVIDGATVYRLDMKTLQEMHCAAVDHSTMVSYWKRDPKDKLDDKAALLLDMVAGARDNSDDSQEDVGGQEASSRGYNRFTGDENDAPVICDNILPSLCRERDAVMENLVNMAPMVDGRRRCPFCPFRSFAQLRLLRTHVHKHHTAKNQFVYSGTKQVKVILALYDHAASSQTSVSDFLQASASLMRRTIEPALGERISYIDKQIRLVLDAAGPRYVNLSAIGSTLHVRRARNLYYTHSFADQLLREMIMGHAQVPGITAVCRMTFFL